MPRIALPPGCYGLKDEVTGKSTPRVRPGSSVSVSDDFARRISRSPNGQLGIVSGTQALAIGTKAGRRCLDCGFLAQAWSASCPRCRGETILEFPR